MANGAPLPVMTVRTRARPGSAFQVPGRLPTCDPSWSAGAEGRFRRVSMDFQRMRWTLAGRTFSMDEVTADEAVSAGSTHVWEFVNQPGGMGMGMGMAHPIQSVRAQVTFTSHPRLYLYHCHILEHEDMGMMRNFRVT